MFLVNIFVAKIFYTEYFTYRTKWRDFALFKAHTHFAKMRVARKVRASPATYSIKGKL